VHRRVALPLVTVVGLALATAGLAGAKAPLPGFRSPSGNIKCLFVPAAHAATLRCEIGRADYAETLQQSCIGPNGGGVDWHGFELAGGRKGGVTCSGGILYNPGTERPSYVTLPYGRSWRHAAFTCWSRTSGVTCRETAGHGLFVSRQRWRVW
jgi:hypothetical protein